MYTIEVYEFDYDFNDPSGESMTTPCIKRLTFNSFVELVRAVRENALSNFEGDFFIPYCGKRPVSVY